MYISKNVDFDSVPNLAKFNTEYFVGVDGKDSEILKKVVMEKQHHLPTLVTALKEMGYELEAHVMNSGRILLVPTK